MICILQVRSSSQRLKKKAFLKLNQKSLIENVIQRLLLSKKISKIFIATSSNYSDDKFKDFINNKKIFLFRGPLRNVFLRYLKLIKKYNIIYFLRISGDSPLIDYRIIDKAYSIFKKKKYQIVTNTLQRSYPKGQSVEIISANIMLENYDKINLNSSYKEHITKYFYDNHKLFKIHNFKYKQDFSKINLSIDTIKDYKKIKKIIPNLNKNFKWQTALKRYNSLK
jgi:spore coat polysaccharide biosynthesis protein SpsF